MIPSEHSSGGRQRLGAMSKQGNALLRYLWCEAAMHAVERDPELKRFYRANWCRKGWANPDLSQQALKANRSFSVDELLTVDY